MLFPWEWGNSRTRRHRVIKKRVYRRAAFRHMLAPGGAAPSLVRPAARRRGRFAIPAGGAVVSPFRPTARPFRNSFDTAGGAASTAAALRPRGCQPPGWGVAEARGIRAPPRGARGANRTLRYRRVASFWERRVAHCKPPPQPSGAVRASSTPDD